MIPSLSGKEFLVMSLLIGARREMYGLEMVTKSEGRLKRGTIYVTLNRLEDKGYIKSRDTDGATGETIPRRLYKVTGLGAKVYNALAGAGGRAWLKEAMA